MNYFQRLKQSSVLRVGVTYALSGCVLLLISVAAHAANVPSRALQGMVVSANAQSSQIGVDVMRTGGNAIDASVAVAFALAVTHPTAGNIGGGGFIIYQPQQGEPLAYDFRELAPAAAFPEMWLVDGEYSYERHHLSHLSVGVPGTVAGLYLAWQEGGSIPWKQLLAPAIELTASGFGSADTLHLMTESMRRAYADRARFIGDPDFNEMPISELISKSRGETQRASINPSKASVSSPDSFTWPAESPETTHFSVVDKDRNAVSLTYTLEYGYGSAIVVPGGGFLLNNEMGDFNAGPGLTDSSGLIGTPANLAEPGKRMLSSMTPTIVTRGGQVFMVTGTPGGRTIINTTLQTILNVVDHQMNAQSAVDAGRVHHQWLPDQLYYEKQAFSPDSLRIMQQRGHTLVETKRLGVAEVIVVNPTDGWLEGGVDRRVPDGGAAGY